MQIIINKNRAINKKYIKKLISLHYSVAKLSFPEKEIPYNYSEMRINSLNDYLQKQEAILFIGITQDEVCCFAWCYEHKFYDEKRLFINIISVDETKRKQGYGSKLINAIEKYAKENKYDSIDVIASLKNEISLKFYEALNYQKERIHYVKKV